MERRYEEEINDSLRNYTLNPNRLIVFCHGFTGGYRNDYWGKIPLFISNDLSLQKVDFLYFGYGTNRMLFPNWKSVVGQSRKVSSIPEIAAVLRDRVSELAERVGYEQVGILGHSLGAHVVLAASEDLVADPKVHLQSLCLVAAPNRALKRAKIFNTISMRQNPQIKFLASDDELTNHLRNKASFLRDGSKNGAYDVKITHIHSAGDPLVQYEPERLFDQSVVLNASHTWFRDINSAEDPRLKQLTRWMAFSS